MNSKRIETPYIEANKMDLLGSQNFLVRDPANGHIFFSVPGLIQVCVLPFNTCTRPTKLYVRVYRNKISYPAAASIQC